MRNEEQWSDTSDIVRVAEKDLYTLEKITSFLDETRGKAGVEVSDFFFPQILKSLLPLLYGKQVALKSFHSRRGFS